MPKKLTTLLLIAVMLALPLRAVAGMAMSGCAMSHAGMAADMMQDAVQQVGDDCQHDMSGAAGHCHDEGDNAPGSQASSGCGACGDCCVGMLSIPMGMAHFSAESPSILVSSSDLPYAGFQPEGPDRPPRHFVS